MTFVITNGETLVHAPTRAEAFRVAEALSNGSLPYHDGGVSVKVFEEIGVFEAATPTPQKDRDPGLHPVHPAVAAAPAPVVVAAPPVSPVAKPAKAKK